MLRDLFDLIGAFLSKVIHSRLFPVTLGFIVLFSVLLFRLFDLQIVRSDYYQDAYTEKIEATIDIPSTRGTIYDCEGRALAYSQLIYNVTIQDTGAYSTNKEKNNMVLYLVRLLDRMNTDIVSSVPVGISEDGTFYYTSKSNAARRRFYRDFLGTSTITEMQEDGDDPYEWSADTLIEYLEKTYYFSKWTDDDGNSVPDTLTGEEILSVLNIRYALAQNMYRKYETAVVAEDVDAATVAAVMENSENMEGVTIEEDNQRVYPYGEVLAAILGYTGAASEDELAELQDSNPDYELGDIVGKAGIEELMELELQGTKGYQKVYKDSTGNILEVVETVPQTSGSDVYLTIDAEKTVGLYNLTEQMIAGILVSHMVNHDVEKIEQKDPDIPVKDAYIHLITNNVLDLEQFENENASEPEKQMYQVFSVEQEAVLSEISSEMTKANPSVYNDLSTEMQDYFDYIYSDLMVTDLAIIDADAIDRTDETYKAWKAGEISYQEFLRHAIEEDWVDTSNLNITEAFSSTDEVYKNILNYVMEDLKDDAGFSKLIYQSLINNDRISGNVVCAALYYQGVLEYDQTQVDALMTGDSETAYNFMIDKITSLEISPDQLALDPCSGAIVVTDVDTGKVLAIMSYPGYDNNLFSGTVDADYYNSLLNDASLPLFNRATLSTMAPGSTFKMVTAAAGLEEGIIAADDTVNCVKVYDKVTPNPSCWVALPGHGDMNVTTALANSCNYYFYELGYRLSETSDGSLNLTQGINKIAEYAAMFGLGEKTGIEIGEATPQISDVEPIASAIGQGTNAYSTVDLARYVTTIASRGNVYQLSLLDHVENCDGETTETFEPVIQSTCELQDSTWDSIWEGMYAVVHSGTIQPHFAECDVEVAAKTGTAQEDKTRSEHAQFVSFAPYDDPEITVTITIPNGYTSGNNAYLANDVYEYWYGYLSQDEILARDAFTGSAGSVDD